MKKLLLMFLVSTLLFACTEKRVNSEVQARRESREAAKKERDESRETAKETREANKKQEKSQR